MIRLLFSKAAYNENVFQRRIRCEDSTKFKEKEAIARN